jgi:hypothetical protein
VQPQSRRRLEILDGNHGLPSPAGHALSAAATAVIATLLLNVNRKNHFGNAPQKSGPDSKAIRAAQVREGLKNWPSTGRILFIGLAGGDGL